MCKDSGEFGEKIERVGQKENPDHSRQDGIGGIVIIAGTVNIQIIVTSVRE